MSNPEFQTEVHEHNDHEPVYRQVIDNCRQKVGRVLLSLTLLAGAGGAIAHTAEDAAADENNYPHQNAQPYRPAVYEWWVDENGNGKVEAPNELKSPREFYYRNCTDWASFRAQNLTGVSIPGWWGNAKNWDNAAKSAGYAVDFVPEPGDVAVWDDGTHGHVAVVESTNPLVISEYNGAGDGKYRRRTNPTGIDHFIDLNGTGKGINGQAAVAPAPKPVPQDLAIYRPADHGQWYVKEGPSGTKDLVTGVPHGGQAGDVPLVGDFNGDKIDDLVIYRNGTWYVKDKNGNFIGPGANGLSHGGWPGDVPMIGDIDGNGSDDFVIVRKINGEMRWITKAGPEGKAYISDIPHGGWEGDVPLIGNIDGDKTDDFVIYRSSQGRWISKAGPSGDAYISDIPHGGWLGDVPLLGDVNGDKKDDFVIVRDVNGEKNWITKAGPSGSNYISHVFHGGLEGDRPMLADIDGNGTEDFVLLRLVGGELNWITKSAPSGSNYISHAVHGGWAGDVSLAGNFG